MKPTRVIKRWPIRLQHGRGVTEAGRTKDGTLVFRIVGSDKFSRWSPPPPVFAYLATEQEPDLSPNERAKALRALGSAHCIIDRRTRKPEV